MNKFVRITGQWVNRYLLVVLLLLQVVLALLAGQPAGLDSDLAAFHSGETTLQTGAGPGSRTAWVVYLPFTVHHRPSFVTRPPAGNPKPSPVSPTLTAVSPTAFKDPAPTQTLSPSPTPTGTQTLAPSPTASQTLTPAQTILPGDTPDVAPTSTLSPPSLLVESWPQPSWAEASLEEAGMDFDLLLQAREYALTGGGSGLITRYGKVVLSWGSSTQRYDLKSSAKSIGVTLLGLALLDGRLELDDLAQSCQPDLGLPPESNATTGWLDEITLLHLATQTAGFNKSGGYTGLLFAPGTMWSYSDGGPNWLADCLTLEYGQDLNNLLFDRVLTPLGVSSSDLYWRSNAYREDTIEGIKRREFGSGISANVDAMARIGYLYLRDGVWNGERLLPAGFPAEAGSTRPEVAGLPVYSPEGYPDASDRYGLLWWNNADGTLENVPRDTFFSWGLGESLIVVISSLDIVAARAGSAWGSDFSSSYDRLEPFLEPLALSVQD
jgi:CubicO group peptidase (beta-lactamase class C family)